MGNESDKFKGVNSSELRECYFYIEYLVKNEIIFRSGMKKNKNTEDICFYINEFIERHYNYDVFKMNNFVTEMVYECKKSILPLSDFDWIKNDSRICLWMWYKCLSPYRENEVLYTYPDENSRFNKIIDYFDRFNLSEHGKKNYMDSYKNDWGHIFKQKKPLSLLDEKSEEECTHIWNYLSKEKYGINEIFIPINQGERYLAIIGYFDCICNTPDKKENLERKINALLSQRRHRQKKGQNNVNKHFYLKKETDLRLKTMLKDSGKTLDVFINDLLEQEYKIKYNASKIEKHKT